MPLHSLLITSISLLAVAACSSLAVPKNYSFDYDIENGRQLGLLQVFSSVDKTYLKVFTDKRLDKKEGIEVKDSEGKEIPLQFDKKLILYSFKGRANTFIVKRDNKEARVRRVIDIKGRQ